MPAPVPTFSEDPIGAVKAFLRISSCSYDGDFVIASSSISTASLCFGVLLLIAGSTLLPLCWAFFERQLRPYRIAIALMIAICVLAVVVAFVGFQAVNTAMPITAAA